MHIVTRAHLIRELRQVGWVLDHVRGSHHMIKHQQRAGIAVVPHPKKELCRGLVAAIRKQAGL